MTRQSRPLSRGLTKMRLVAQHAARSVGRRVLPAYLYRKLNERLAYFRCTAVHDLPPIFHYWSNRYVRPKMERFGFSTPDQFFEHYTAAHCRDDAARTHQVLSIGAGNCDLEANLARSLIDAGTINFHVTCLDLNPVMLRRGRRLVEQLGLERHFRFEGADFNRWTPDRQYDVVIANQVLHHVVELERLFAAIRTSLAENGLFLTSDMIGRNGHQRWPEAREALEPLWAELPREYKFNHLRYRVDEVFRDRDCSQDSFEGIRAQDILPLLVEHFEFELFVPFGNLIFVFVDREYGPNFDPDREWDRAFIDRVAELDERLILEGTLKPTQMVAALRQKGARGPDSPDPKLVHPTLTPEFCIRPPGRRHPGQFSPREATG